jgi:hypothetical protein
MPTLGCPNWLGTGLSGRKRLLARKCGRQYASIVGDLALAILVPAVVAAVVTLITELVAQPYVEIHKKRVLRQDDQRQELIDAFRAVDSGVRQLRIDISKDQGLGSIEDEEIEGEIEDLDQNIQRADDISISVHGRLLPRSLDGLAAWSLGDRKELIRRLRRASHLPEGERREHYLNELSSGSDFDLPIQYMETSRWRPLKRQRLAEEGQRLYDERESSTQSARTIEPA